MRATPVFAVLCVCVSSSLAGAAEPQGASASPFPTKTMRMFVAYAPGGTVDIIARIVTPKLSENLGQQIIVDNRLARAAVRRSARRRSSSHRPTATR